MSNLDRFVIRFARVTGARLPGPLSRPRDPPPSGTVRGIGEIETMLKLISMMRVDETRTDAFMLAAHELVSETRQEAGNVAYELWRDGNRKDIFLFDELWRSVDAWHAHMETPHLKAFKAAVDTVILESEVIPAKPVLVNSD
ncbi:antibiotic biosynthesis monooxygenase [Acuticoccus sp. M5D2P5]|uniref:putative quinol monooxygenase n=1 Tax=Acuticoccus kalidii TaxID=2910977 RepID=UPI001F3C2A1C|nr:putative quinol monooxygenase [Acuticoccus kalidii]MCF3933487.1 antibiotic biosynthesis monooxygenase [Acuticoccus kalidii]